MHNVSHRVDNGKLVIEIDVSPTALKNAPASSTGKTKLVASTSGSVAIPAPNGAPMSFSLNVMTK